MKEALVEIPVASGNELKLMQRWEEARNLNKRLLKDVLKIEKIKRHIHQELTFLS